MNDLKFAFRQLLKNPGFTVVAVLTLALGIGANTSMFSLVNTMLFQALPYQHSERLVKIFRTSPHSQRWPHSAGNFLGYRSQNGVFDGMTAYRGSSYNLAEAGAATERLDGLRVTADFFSCLGVAPALGRLFRPEEDEPGGGGQVVILSDHFWLRRFGGDSNIVGRTLRLDGQSVTVIGIMPAHFDHPLLWDNVDLWRPMAFSQEQRLDHDNSSLQVFGRLRPGITLRQAEAELKAIAARMAKDHPLNALDSLRLEPLQRQVADDVGRKLSWLTFGLAGFVLLIACANLGNLQLVRTAERMREFAIRAALGAQRGRLLKQSLTESLAISFLGGTLGLLLANWCNGIIGRQLFRQLPGMTLALDWRVFIFALAVSMLTGVLFGLLPAWMAARADVNEALKENLRGTTAGRAHHRVRHFLVVGEVSFALVLLTGAGLFIGGLQRYLHLDPGWRVEGVVFAPLSLKGTNYARSFQRRPFLQQLEQRVSAIPGVASASLSESLPVWPFGSSGGMQVEGRPLSAGQPVPEVYHETVSGRHFETLGIRLRAGRFFNEHDTTNSPRVLIINEAMARTFWPNESPIGQRVANPGPDPAWKQIVGVVNDVRFPASLGEPYTRFQSYEPMAQSSSSRVVIALRSSLSLETVAASLRGIVAELDRDQSIQQVRTARGLIEQGLGGVSLVGDLLAAFALLGLVLAAIGIYGVTSYTVVQRTGEIGIRMALGAQRRDVLWLVLRNGLRLSLLGTAFGLAGAWAVARLLAWAIPVLPAHNPATFGGVTIGLIAATLLACYLPAQRATRVNPMEALRHE